MNRQQWANYLGYSNISDFNYNLQIYQVPDNKSQFILEIYAIYTQHMLSTFSVDLALIDVCAIEWQIQCFDNPVVSIRMFNTNQENIVYA